MEAGVSERIYLPAAALCIDCAAIFTVGPERCPACAAATWLPLERFFAGRTGRVALEDVLHEAGNGLTPARVRAALLAQTLEYYVAVGFARQADVLRVAIRRAYEVVDAIDTTMARLRALGSPPPPADSKE